MNTTLNYSQQCTQFAHTLRYVDIPQPVIDHSKKAFLDWLGCAIQGASRVQALPAQNVLQKMGGNAHVPLIGMEGKNSVLNAAFYHGYIGHILEMDDVDRESITHPAAAVIPAALAVAIEQGLQGKALLTAIVAGYEVMLTVGAAITPAHYQIWHTTATTGALGAAIASGKLLHLMPEQLDWALGNAGTMAAGVWQFLNDGAMSKYLHTGRAAENGVLAAYLAKENFTGSNNILEGKQGFFAAFARQSVDLAIFDQLGKRFRTQTVSFKPYPCCRHTHSAINAGMALHGKIDLQQIEHIHIYTYNNAFQVANRKCLKTVQDAKFNISYCVSRALQFGDIQESRDFTVDAINDSTTLKLVSVTDVSQCETLNQKLPQAWPCRLEIGLKTGEKLISQVDTPKGDPDNPLSWVEIEQKFMMMTHNILSSQQQRHLIEICRGLEDLQQLEQLIVLK